MNELKNQRFPTGSYFILWNIFFDRFSSGGFIGKSKIKSFSELNKKKIVQNKQKISLCY